MCFMCFTPVFLLATHPHDGIINVEKCWEKNVKVELQLLCGMVASIFTKMESQQDQISWIWVTKELSSDGQKHFERDFI